MAPAKTQMATVNNEPKSYFAPKFNTRAVIKLASIARLQAMYACAISKAPEKLVPESRLPILLKVCHPHNQLSSLSETVSVKDMMLRAARCGTFVDECAASTGL